MTTNKDENGLLPCREAFEKWYGSTPEFGKYCYTSNIVQARWEAWQAVWNTRATPDIPEKVDVEKLKRKVPKGPTHRLLRPCELQAIMRAEMYNKAIDHLAAAGYLREPQQSQSGDVQAALDAICNGLSSLSIEERDCYQSGFSSEGLRLANIGSQIGAALQTIRAALTAQQPDVNQELLDDTGLFCIINILEKAKVCAQNIIYDLPMGHNSGQQAIYARNYIHKAIYALQTATMQESVNAELLEALKEAVRLWEQHDPIHEYHINEWKKAIDRAALTAQQDVNQELLDALKSVLSHVENEDVKRVSDQCTLCYSYRKMVRDVIARAEQKGEIKCPK